MRVKVIYDGIKWKIYYLGISDFVEDLKGLGKFLDKVSTDEGHVTAIIPNIGLTKTSIFLGTSFQGVKGFAVIVRKW